MTAPRTHRLTFAQMVQLREKHEVEARDLACQLLGGDPMLADEVTRRVFRALLGHTFATERSLRGLLSSGGLPRTIWQDVGYACAESLADPGILHLSGYLWRKRCAEGMATRKARRALEGARVEARAEAGKAKDDLLGIDPRREALPT